VSRGKSDVEAPAVGVDAEGRAAGPAEKIVDRLLRDFSDDVPQRLFDPGRGAIKLQRAASLRIVIERDLNDVADMERVAANKIAAKLLDLRRDGAVAVVLTVRLAPSDDPCIGRDPRANEILAPTGMDRKTFDAGDLHCVPRSMNTTLNAVSASMIVR